MNKENPYQDIIDLPHPNPRTHPRMSMEKRAAQFSPFAALTGYEAAVEETHRRTDRRLELSESEREELDYALANLSNQLEDYSAGGVQYGRTELPVTVTYFVPDRRKEGGEYITVNGTVKKLDRYRRILVLNDTREIPVEEIVRIEM